MSGGPDVLAMREWLLSLQDRICAGIEEEDGQDAIAIGSMMNVTPTYDHRLVDGALAGRFLRDLRERLQSWDESTE